MPWKFLFSHVIFKKKVHERNEMRRDRNQRGLALMPIWWPFMFQFYGKCRTLFFQCNCNATGQLDVSSNLYRKLLFLFIKNLYESQYLRFSCIDSIYAMLVIIRINVFIYYVAYQKWIYNMSLLMCCACYIIFILL